MGTIAIQKSNTRYLMPLFWLTVAVLHYVCDLIATGFIGRENELLYASLYYVGWFYWIPLSSLVKILSARIPVDEGNLAGRLAIHSLLALVVAAIHQTLDFFTIYGLKMLFYPANTGAPLYHISYTTFIHFIVYFFVLGVYSSLRYFKELKTESLRSQELRTKLAQAQIKTLEMQIQPHFLFNTHNAIISLMHNNRNEDAINMLSKLSDLLRYTLDQTENKFVKLADEIHYIELYLDIQKVRFKDRLVVNFDLAESTLGISVPNFILQPLIENAIKHGIEPYSSSGNLTIKSQVKDDCLQLSVVDDGRGINTAAKEGIGIKNIKKRLDQIYNGKFRFDLLNNKTRGATSHISIPLSIEP